MSREKKKKRIRARRPQAPSKGPARTSEPGFRWAWRISAALGLSLIVAALLVPRISQAANLYLRFAGTALIITAFLFFRTRK